MNHSLSIRRRSCRSLMLIAAVFAMLAVIAVIPAQDDAAAKGSIKSRTESQEDQCHLGGGLVKVQYEYTKNGPFVTLVKTTTTCTGGAGDGHTCVNTQNNTTCTQAHYHFPGAEWGNLPVLQGVGQIEQDPGGPASPQTLPDFEPMATPVTDRAP